MMRRQKKTHEDNHAPKDQVKEKALPHLREGERRKTGRYITRNYSYIVPRFAQFVNSKPWKSKTQCTRCGNTGCKARKEPMYDESHGIGTPTV